MNTDQIFATLVITLSLIVLIRHYTHKIRNWKDNHSDD